jgi:hypothetical protein
MANIFMMNKEIARGMVCFFHQKKRFYLFFKNDLRLAFWSPRFSGSADNIVGCM